MTTSSNTAIAEWFATRFPADWFTGPADIRSDSEEILVVGPLPVPEVGDDAEAQVVACRARIQGFREDTRALRMRSLARSVMPIRGPPAGRTLARCSAGGCTCGGRCWPCVSRR